MGHSPRRFTLAAIAFSLAPLGACSTSTNTAAEVDWLAEGDYFTTVDGALLSPVGPTAPPEPDEWVDQFTPTGALHAASHFLDLLAYAWNTGDTDAFMEASFDDCPQCLKHRDRVEEHYASGYWHSGIDFDITSIEYNWDLSSLEEYPDDTREIVAVFQASPYTYYDGDLSEEPAEEIRYVFHMQWDGSRWRMLEFGIPREEPSGE